jgi:hypothetical protein
MVYCEMGERTRAALRRTIPLNEHPHIYCSRYILHGKRVELLALSNQLREAHIEVRATVNLLKQESKELSKESRVLRDCGERLRRAVDAELVPEEVKALI